jgi:hypothetical protein
MLLQIVVGGSSVENCSQIGSMMDGERAGLGLLLHLESFSTPQMIE